MTRPPAEEAAPGSPAETGNTGVPEPQDSAQASDWPDVDGWTIHAGLDGDISIGHHSSRALLTGKDIPVGAVLAFIADQEGQADER